MCIRDSFYLPHREETRGIGGIFFDYKKENWEKDFNFVRDVGLTFKRIFGEIINKKNNKKLNIFYIDNFKILYTCWS